MRWDTPIGTNVDKYLNHNYIISLVLHLCKWKKEISFSLHTCHSLFLKLIQDTENSVNPWRNDLVDIWKYGRKSFIFHYFYIHFDFFHHVHIQLKKSNPTNADLLLFTMLQQLPTSLLSRSLSPFNDLEGPHDLTSCFASTCMTSSLTGFQTYFANLQPESHLRTLATTTVSFCLWSYSRGSLPHCLQVLAGRPHP